MEKTCQMCGGTMDLKELSKQEKLYFCRECVFAERIYANKIYTKEDRYCPICEEYSMMEGIGGKVCKNEHKGLKGEFAQPRSEGLIQGKPWNRTKAGMKRRRQKSKMVQYKTEAAEAAA